MVVHTHLYRSRTDTHFFPLVLQLLGPPLDKGLNIYTLEVNDLTHNLGNTIKLFKNLLTLFINITVIILTYDSIINLYPCHIHLPA
ncbi:hypothetical protein ES705_25158 [subsurface metagenome]